MQIYGIGRMVYEVLYFFCPNFVAGKHPNCSMHGRLDTRINAWKLVRGKVSTLLWTDKGTMCVQYDGDLLFPTNAYPVMTQRGLSRRKI